MIHSPFSKTKQIPRNLRGICLKQSRPKLLTFQCCQMVCAFFFLLIRWLFSIKQKVSMWAFAAMLDASRKIRVYPTKVIRSRVPSNENLWTHLYLVLTTSAVNLRQMLIPDVCRAIVFTAAHSHIALR